MSPSAVAWQSRWVNPTKSGKRSYEFSHFRLDIAEHLLLRRGIPIQLSPKVFDTLRILVENAGHVLTKEELLRQVWPDTFVEENNLNKSISVLRKILGESLSDPAYIETVPKLGYRFIAQVMEYDDEPPKESGSREGVPSKSRVETGNGKESVSLVADNQPPRKTRGPLHAQKAVLVLVLLGLSLGSGYYLRFRWRSSEGRGPSGARSRPATLTRRRSIAVLAFQNLARRPEVEWLSTAIPEMLTTELAASKGIREIPEENVARMKADLRLADADTLSKDTLARVHRNLDVDLVVVGSYTALGTKAGGKLRLDLRLQDARQGETLAAVSETDTEANLFELVSRSGARLREELGLVDAATPETGDGPTSLPSNLRAARLYAEGLAKLRAFNPLAAQNLLEKAVAADSNFAPAHSALAEAWSTLGYDSKAKEEAKEALNLSRGLSRQQHSMVEGRYRETSHEWNKAIEIYRSLFDAFPDNLEYGLRLGAAQNSADKGKDALATVEALRGLASATGRSGDDPRIDLVEASAAASLGDFDRAQRACEAAATKGRARGDSLLLAKARYLEARAFASLGQPKQAAAAVKEARRIFAAAGDRKGEVQALNGIGILLRHQGDLGEARRNYERALAIARQIGDKGDEVVELDNIGLVLTDQGDLTSARRAYEQSLPASRQLGDKGGVALELNNLGNVLSSLGHLEEARKAYEEALGLCREIGDQDGVAYALANLADVLQHQGHLRDAATMYEEALGLCVLVGDRYLSAQALDGLGEIAAQQANFVVSRQKHEEALAVWNQLGEEGKAAASRLNLARLSIDEGRPSDGEASARQAAEVFQKEKTSDNEAEAMAILSQSLAAQRKLGEAAKEIDHATALSAGSQNFELHLSVATSAARIRALAAQRAEASKLLDSALSSAMAAGFVGYQLETRLAAGEIEMRSGQSAVGRSHLAVVEKEANDKGFLLIARKAAEAMRSE